MIALGFLAVIAIYAVLTLSALSSEGLKNTIFSTVCAVIFFYFSSEGTRVVYAKGAGPILLLFSGLVLFFGLSFNLATKNTISGVTTYFLMAAGLVYIARGASLLSSSTLVFLGVSCIGLLLEHRMIAGLGAGTLIFIVLLQAAPLGIVRNLFLVCMAATVLVVIAFFTGLWGFDIHDVDKLIMEYTGRTAQSGRQIIWPIIILNTSQSPWLGLGTGTTFSTLYNSEWSAHSYYLQTYMQTGLVGLSSVIFLLFSIWRAIGRPRRKQPLTIYLSGCFLLLIMHASSEVFLLQVSLLMGCSAWMLFGLGLGALRCPPRKSNIRHKTVVVSRMAQTKAPFPCEAQSITELAHPTGKT
jgi:O-antigen ligase